jgi:hypothetical protein
MECCKKKCCQRFQDEEFWLTVESQWSGIVLLVNLKGIHLPAQLTQWLAVLTSFVNFFLQPECVLKWTVATQFGISFGVYSSILIISASLDAFNFMKRATRVAAAPALPGQQVAAALAAQPGAAAPAPQQGPQPQPLTPFWLSIVLPVFLQLCFDAVTCVPGSNVLLLEPSTRCWDPSTPPTLHLHSFLP